MSIYVLTEKQWAQFLETMSTPREPTAAMKLAAQRHALLVAAAGKRNQPWTDDDIKNLVADTAHAND